MRNTQQSKPIFRFSSTVMAKMKSADSIYAALGLEPTGYLRPCYALNQMSLELAMAAASPTALNRMLARGRNLTLGEDQVMGWGGLAWEYGSLEWTTLPDGTIQLTSARLTSGIYSYFTVIFKNIFCAPFLYGDFSSHTHCTIQHTVPQPEPSISLFSRHRVIRKGLSCGIAISHFVLPIYPSP